MIDEEIRPEDFFQLSRLILTVLRGLAPQGQKPTVENLARGLAVHPELTKVLMGMPQEEMGREEFRLRYERLESQKNLLTEEIRKEKAEFQERFDFMQRAMLTLTRMVKQTASPEIEASMKSLQTILGSDDPIPLIEDAMEALKNEMIRARMNQGGPEKDRDQPEDFSDNDALSSDKVLGEMKNGYLEILGEMDLDLGEDYRRSMDSLRRRIALVDSVESLLALRKDIEEAVKKYARFVFSERKQFASFMGEVARRLTEMERHLHASAAMIQEGHESNIAFHKNLEAEIEDTSSSVMEIDRLEDLRELVLKKLNVLGEKIKEKSREEMERMNDLGQDMSGLKKEYLNAQCEVGRVQDENRSLLYKLRMDCLTGAYNRYAYEERLNAEFRRFRRYRRVFALIMLDVDNFKNINDTFGHIVGDRCLKETVNNIKTILRSSDVLARYGGDEFVILMPETDRERALATAEKVRRAIEETDFLVRGRKIPYTVSMGVSVVQDADEELEALVHRADKALYQAKNKGRNRIDWI